MEPLRSTETMRAKERVLQTFAFETPDRIPVNYIANPGIDRRVKARLGIRPDDHEGLFQALGVDFRGLWPAYTGPRLHPEQPGRQVDPQWGWHTRWIAHQNGGYQDYCDFPLADADEETVAAWPMPDPDHFDYDEQLAFSRRFDAYAIHAGHAGLACIMNTAGFFRGMEQLFVDLATADPAGMLLIDRFLDIQFEILVRLLDKTRGQVDFLWLGEDLGTQRGPLISRELFLTQILPRQKRFFDLAAAYNLPVMLHACGASSWTYEDYMKIGLKGVDTLQPEAAGMDPATLKKQFGGRLFFHGAISTAGVLAFGSADEVVSEVRQTLDIMMPGSGYCLAPTHALQDNTPTENVLALYRAAHQYGRYT